MTPERLAEIRAQLDKVPECRTGNVEDLAEELLAEVDRLEAANALLAQRLGSASLAIHYGAHHGPYASCMAESCRLDREVARPDSAPAPKGHS